MPESPPAKILLVEDEPRLARATLRILARMGYEAEHAPDGATALARARDARFGVVILDLGLPDRSGTEVLADLRRDHPDLPIIVSSGSGEAGVVASPGVTLLPKPFSAEQLADAVAEALGRGS